MKTTILNPTDYTINPESLEVVVLDLTLAGQQVHVVVEPMDLLRAAILSCPIPAHLFRACETQLEEMSQDVNKAIDDYYDADALIRY